MPGEHIRNDTMFRADGQSHANSVGLIGGSSNLIAPPTKNGGSNDCRKFWTSL
jgi:hypothetical protein